MKRIWISITAAALVITACSSEADGPLRVYTTVTQETVDAIVAGFEAETGTIVEVLRVPTGELNARIASEMRSGGLTADVLWLTDPLSMQQYETDELLESWAPDGADQIDPSYVTPASWGTRILNLVIVAGENADPLDWSDLPELPEPVAIPDPGFAGSAFAALAYFSLTDGFEFYQALADADAVQVQSPGEVVTGVAEGRFTAGITLDFAARAAVDSGSPVTLVWPSSGAIAFHSPIAVVAESERSDAAHRFVEYVISVPGQEAIAGTGWQAVLDGIGDAPDGPQQTIDWSQAVDRQEELLDRYRQLFGG